MNKFQVRLRTGKCRIVSSSVEEFNAGGLLTENDGSSSLRCGEIVSGQDHDGWQNGLEGMMELFR